VVRCQGLGNRHSFQSIVKRCEAAREEIGRQGGLPACPHRARSGRACLTLGKQGTLVARPPGEDPEGLALPSARNVVLA